MKSKINKIIILIYLLDYITMAQASTLEGCTFVHSGFIQSQITFLSSDSGVICQYNRCNCSYRIDTFLYSINKYDLISTTPIHPGKNNVDSLSYSPCRIIPYIFRDGYPIKNMPVGGITTNYWMRNSPIQFYSTRIGKSISLPGPDLKMRLVSKNFLECICGENGNDEIIIFKLQSGEPIFTEILDSILNINPQLKGSKMDRYIRREYDFEELWFSRKLYNHSTLNTLTNRTYEFSSIIRESFHFINDTSCIYTQQLGAQKGSAEYYCNYCILPNGIVVIKADSVSKKGINAKDYMSLLHMEQCDSPSNENIFDKMNAIDEFSCDSFLLCSDFMISTKFYRATMSTNTVQLPVYMLPMEKYRLISKVYVYNKKRVSSLKIGKTFKHYYTPINY